MDRVVRLFAAGSLAGMLLNVAMFIVLLASVGDPMLFVPAGAVATVLFAAPGLWRALLSTLRRDPARRVVERLLLWIPGAVALALSAVALVLIARSGGHGTQFVLGVSLFAFELAMLAVAVADLRRRPAAAE